jgi:hypothetical protein
MTRIMRLYYYGVAGAIGGLIAWQLSNLIGLSFTPILYLNEMIVGAVIGLCIGVSIGLVEGVLRQNLVYSLRSVAVFAGLGAAGGAIGLPLAEGLFQLSGGIIFGRLFGWAVFGLLIGLAAGWMGGAQVWKSGLGGFIGGLTGGVILSSLQRWLSDALMGKAIGLILLGTSIGVFIALIVYLLSRAWIVVKSGKLKGMEFVLDKFMKQKSPSAFIGSDALKAEIVLPDPDIAPQHAMLKGFETHFTIKDMSMIGTFLNNKKIEVARLSDHQVIRLGNTEMVYYEKR